MVGIERGGRFSILSADGTRTSILTINDITLTIPLSMNVLPISFSQALCLQQEVTVFSFLVRTEDWAKY